jgi:hypothetical protein
MGLTDLLKHAGITQDLKTINAKVERQPAYQTNLRAELEDFCIKYRLRYIEAQTLFQYVRNENQKISINLC